METCGNANDQFSIVGSTAPILKVIVGLRRPQSLIQRLTNCSRFGQKPGISEKLLTVGGNYQFCAQIPHFCLIKNIEKKKYYKIRSRIYYRKCGKHPILTFKLQHQGHLKLVSVHMSAFVGQCAFVN